ncbi:hypothetical protein GSI_07874 [Ganoderma sinense ZZ0214-1]|uniref:Uncharacterized protein n=1 Tax=Ganoderma sinense ZZ0214-1 TaxID=1077348 RepID=A0A2G8S861_9APHY|nr:hypothetical protein GSI_07874 [Ganoderma sinense ZZ0214-1]
MWTLFYCMRILGDIPAIKTCWLLLAGYAFAERRQALLSAALLQLRGHPWISVQQLSGAQGGIVLQSVCRMDRDSLRDGRTTRYVALALRTIDIAPLPPPGSLKTPFPTMSLCPEVPIRAIEAHIVHVDSSFRVYVGHVACPVARRILNHVLSEPVRGSFAADWKPTPSSISFTSDTPYPPTLEDLKDVSTTSGSITHGPLSIGAGIVLTLVGALASAQCLPMQDVVGALLSCATGVNDWAARWDMLVTERVQGWHAYMPLPSPEKHLHAARLSPAPSPGQSRAWFRSGNRVCATPARPLRRLRALSLKQKIGMKQWLTTVRRRTPV